MLCLVHSHTRRNFLLVYLPHRRLCWHYYTWLILTNAGSPRAAMSNNLPVLIIIHFFPVITDRAIRCLDKEIVGNFCQHTVFPFPLLDDTSNHTSNGLCLVKNANLNLKGRVFKYLDHAHR